MRVLSRTASPGGNEQGTATHYASSGWLAVRAPTPNHARYRPRSGGTAFGQPPTKPTHSLGGRDGRPVAKVASCAVDREVMRSGELGRQKSSHDGLARNPQQAIDRFQAAAHAPGGRGRHPAPHRRQTGQFQNGVHPLPTANRLALTDEVGPARDGRVGLQGVGRLQMGLRRHFRRTPCPPGSARPPPAAAAPAAPGR